MKKTVKRLLHVVLAVCMLLTLAALIPQEAQAASGMTLAEMQAKYPDGKYWNHAGNPGSSNSVNNPDGYTSTPCSKHGVVGTSQQTCNGFTAGGKTQLSWQCMGFAEQLGYLATGYNPRNNANGWSTIKNVSALDSLKPGDIVRYKNNNHSIYVTAVNGDTVTYADCNSDGHCVIRWNKTISKSTLKATFSYVRSAPFAVPGGSTSCSCSEAYAGEYICTTTSASLNIRSGHGASYSKVGSIPSGATVYVSKATGTGVSDWAHVEYNGVSGYASMQYLAPKQSEPQVAPKIQCWFSLGQMGDAISAATQGDWIYLCYRMFDGNSGKDLDEVLPGRNYQVTETIYHPDGSVAFSYSYSNDDASWIGTGCTMAGTYTYEVVLTGDWSGTYTGSLQVAANPKRIYSSTNSVALTIGGQESCDISVWTGGYYDGSTVISFGRSNDNISCAWGEWQEDGTCPLTITARSVGTTTVTLSVKDKDSGTVLHSITVEVTVKAKGYTVSYNANGGTGAPNSQTKNHGSNLTLSSGVPTRSGYSFLGWATSAGATAAEYQPGGTYSGNANLTLYAVWKVNTYTVSYNANGGTGAPATETFKMNSYGIVSDQIPTREGYRFLGWCLNSNADSADFQPGDLFTSSGNIVFYAVWEALGCEETGDHSYDNGICVNCGAKDPSYSFIEILRQPEDAGTVKGAMVYTWVEARGEGLQYQWYVKEPGSSRFAKSSIRTDTYKYAMTAAKSGRQVYCIITDRYGNSVQTETVTLTMLAITRQPGNMTAANGQRISTTVQARGDGLQYQWYVKEAGSKRFVESSIRSKTYDFIMTSAKSGRQVYCVITDRFGNEVRTNTVTFSNLAITRQPGDASAANGQTVTVSVQASGQGLQYQWYVKNPGGSSFGKSSITGSVYSYTMTGAKDGRQVYCVITDKYGNTLKTEVVTLRMEKGGSITILRQPEDCTVSLGQIASASVRAQGEGLKYQWYFRNPGSKSFAKSSVTGATYTCTMTEAKDGRQIYCLITDKYGNTLRTETVTLTLLKPAAMR